MSNIDQTAIINLNDNENANNNFVSSSSAVPPPPPYSECVENKEYADTQPLLQSSPNSTSNYRNYSSVPYTQVIIVGGCPACRVGVLEDDYTCFGICCAILCFPIGILCCLGLKQRKCTNCGAIYG